jgi:hypothetical protein
MIEKLALVFHDNKKARCWWLEPFFGKRFRGVAAMKEIDGQWISLHVFANRFRMDKAKYSYDSFCKMPGMEPMELEVEVDGYDTNPSRFFMTPIRCVAIAKMLLGIHNWRIITPMQLYRHLKSGSAKGVKITRG